MKTVLLVCVSVGDTKLVLYSGKSYSLFGEYHVWMKKLCQNVMSGPKRNDRNKNEKSELRTRLYDSGVHRVHFS